MASPMPNQPFGGWTSNSQQVPSQPEQNESGGQVKPMGLKVHYTFDKENKVNCLARYPHTLNIQTIPIDETSTIGIIDLRLCIRAVTECSPELAEQDCDYIIYAYDYSEPDTPLVGQGMLSRAVESLQADFGQQAKLVTGRVTKNLLGVFGGGNRETLEVKLKLTESVKRSIVQETPQFSESQYQQPQAKPMETALTPTGVAEWSSFMQSNPQLAQPATFSRGASPAMSQAPAPMPLERRDSFTQSTQPTVQQNSFQRIAPAPVEGGAVVSNVSMAPTSRPSSRASNSGRVSKKVPTGRPRGRPRKKPVEGNTSGYEDGTEGEDGPSKKRAKTTIVEKPNHDPFGTGSDSLRVAASTSGSIRSFRPVAMSGDAVPGNHLQEVPRAPTPVPQGPASGPPNRGKTNLRRETTMSRELFAGQSLSQFEKQHAEFAGQDDGRSPESTAPTPAYSDDSAGDIGSSPPVPRTTSFLRSSPPVSSPVLPPMPQPLTADGEKLPIDDEIEDLFGEEQSMPLPVERAPSSYHQQPKIGPRKPSSTIPMQIFRMEDGPDGRDMVHLRSFNTPDMPVNGSGPSTTSTAPTKKKRPSKPRAQPAKRKPQLPSPPSLAPTPPPTTDAAEKPASPMPVMDPTTENFQQADNQAPLVPGLVPRPIPGPASTAGFVRPKAEPSPPESTKEQSAPAESSQSTPCQPIESVNEPVGAMDVAVAGPSKTNSAPKTKASKPKQQPRKLNRSQSAGPLALTLPAVPASEPAGPSSLSQSMTAGPEAAATAFPSSLRRSASTGPLALPVPASDPVGPVAAPTPLSNLVLPEPAVLPTDPILPLPSSPTGKSNKNSVKKYAIKQRLETAIMNGEMPPYCNNCGAIETPTWRKIWVQDYDGEPEPIDYSSQPGKVTAMEILTRDNDDTPTSYRLIKKSLLDEEDRDDWQGHLLCNPCGIWLVKAFCHRPQDRWNKDADRLGQERRKRGPGGEGGRSRSKKSRTKSDAQSTHETNCSAQPSQSSYHMSQPQFQGLSQPAPVSLPQDMRTTQPRVEEGPTNPADSPEDDELGATKRLLFPSPKKDVSLKILGEVDINIVQTSTDCRQLKEFAGDGNLLAAPNAGNLEPDDLESLFRSPVPGRPCTPPPNAKSGPPTTPFKTPSRATPSHRPITRSVSRSIRSLRSRHSPSQLQRTPSKTPRSEMSRRRSPRNQHGQSDDHFGDEMEGWNSPCSRAIAKMLSDQHPMLSEPNFGFSDELDIDFSDLPPMEATQSLVKDVSTWLSTDGVLPTSPDKQAAFFDYDGSADVLEDWNLMQDEKVHKTKK